MASPSVSYGSTGDKNTTPDETIASASGDAPSLETDFLLPEGRLDLDENKESEILKSESESGLEEWASSRLKKKPFKLEEDELNFFTALTFNWISPLLALGNSKDQLDPDDLRTIPLPQSCKTQRVSSLFGHHWKGQVQYYKYTTKYHKKKNGRFSKTQKKKQPSIGWSLAMAFGGDFLQAGILKLIHDANVFVGPNVLHGLIQFLRDENAPLQRGLTLAVTVTISQTIMSFCLRHYFFKCYMTGLRMRTAIVVAVYEKALVLASTERQKRSVGEIVNLMTVDAQRIQDLTTYLHAIWYSFFQISLSIYFLWKQLGPSCLGGVAVIIVMVPFNKIIAAWMGRLQKRLMIARDERVNVNNEVLSNMKVIKLQAWEGSFQTRILSLRKIELHHLFNYVIANTFSIMMWTAVPLLVALATFTTYTFLGHTLDVASALTSLALFEILRFPLFMLPQVLNNLVEAAVSFDRVRNFLLSDEHEGVDDTNVSEGEVKVHGATFMYDGKKPRFNSKGPVTDDDDLIEEIYEKDWEAKLLKAQLRDAEEKIKALVEGDAGIDAKKMSDVTKEEERDFDGVPADLLALRRIDFNSTGGELIAIVGQVGSGKTSFLSSLLGEVRKLSGVCAIKGRLAYFPQLPFIMNETLQNNVMFSRKDEQFDKKRYDVAVSTCALEHDITMLSDGDQTEIGEKGITLSGGQKARVALARCVYHDADIYLLDDPLAAVDAHVGKHIFQKCIVDELLLRKSSTSRMERQSSVLLVTNAIQYLSDPNVSKIVVLDGGNIAEVGTYDALSNQPNSLFSSFLSVIDETGSNQLQKEEIEKPPQMVEDSNDSNEMETTEKLGSVLTAIVSAYTPLKRNRALSDDAEELAGLVMSDAKESFDREKKLSSFRESTSKNEELDGKERDIQKLMTSELQEREVGHVGYSVYIAWTTAAGGIFVGIALLLGYTIDQSVKIMSKWWLTYWSRNAGFDEFGFLRIYAIINMIAIFTMFARVILIFMAGLRASRLIFAEMLDVVLRAPMAFYDTTPIGRIVNRFSTDVFTLDEKLVATMRSYLATLSNVIGTIIVVSCITPYFTLCLIPMIAFYVKQQMYFVKTYRELKRLDSVSRSPLYALLGETLDGLSSIRAFNAEPSLIRKLCDVLDLQQNAYFLTTTAQCWLAIRLELIGTLIVFASCMCAVLEHGTQGGNETFAGLAGLAISFALSITQSLNWSVRMGSDLEAHMVSVERIMQYCKIPSEAPHTLTQDDDSCFVSWPQNGEITFSDAQLRYRPNLPLVLKGLDIHIPAQSKVGVVGRTGAGKSTLMVSLLRLVELSNGSIVIDGVDIRTVGLNLLRSRIAVIPQDPVLFSGTVRSNLDPFAEYGDERLNEVLLRVGLKAALQQGQSSNSLKSLADSSQQMAIKSLGDEVFEGGTNYSVGQRQLLVIARALLRGAKIVIMDEATASVDADTDARIQRVMRTEFKNSTCITIAHRINTILDSDLILVMDNGSAEEFDKPENLLREGGLFRDLVNAWEEGKERCSTYDGAL